MLCPSCLREEHECVNDDCECARGSCVMRRDADRMNVEAVERKE